MVGHIVCVAIYGFNIAIVAGLLMLAGSKAVDPQVAVISVGADNRFGHPAPEVLDRYAEQGVPALRTDELGTLEFVTDGERLWVQGDWNTTTN